MIVSSQTIPIEARNTLRSVAAENPAIELYDVAEIGKFFSRVAVRLKPRARYYEGFGSWEGPGTVKQYRPAVVLTLQEDRTSLLAEIDWVGHSVQMALLIFPAMFVATLLYDYSIDRLGTDGPSQWAVAAVAGTLFGVLPLSFVVRWYVIGIRDLRLLRGFLKRLTQT